MSRFGMITEDPFYDEDGVLIDEDFDEAEWEEAFPPATKEEIDAMLEDLNPYNTVNS